MIDRDEYNRIMRDCADEHLWDETPAEQFGEPLMSSWKCPYCKGTGKDLCEGFTCLECGGTGELEPDGDE